MRSILRAVGVIIVASLFIAGSEESESKDDGLPPIMTPRVKILRSLKVKSTKEGDPPYTESSGSNTPGHMDTSPYGSTDSRSLFMSVESRFESDGTPSEESDNASRYKTQIHKIIKKYSQENYNKEQDISETRGDEEKISEMIAWLNSDSATMPTASKDALLAKAERAQRRMARYYRWRMENETLDREKEHENETLDREKEHENEIRGLLDALKELYKNPSGNWEAIAEKHEKIAGLLRDKKYILSEENRIEFTAKRRRLLSRSVERCSTPDDAVRLIDTLLRESNHLRTDATLPWDLAEVADLMEKLEALASDPNIRPSRTPSNTRPLSHKLADPVPSTSLLSQRVNEWTERSFSGAMSSDIGHLPSLSNSPLRKRRVTYRSTSSAGS